MKLTQTAARRPGAPQSDFTPLADRIERLEQSIERIEHAPIAAPEAHPGPAPADFHRKVIEAVVQTVDERLNQHDTQMERRLAGDMQDVAESVAKLVDQQVPSLVAALLHPVEEQLREEIERVAGRSSSLYASALEAAIEMKLAPLRAELNAKNREITEMRQRLADSDRTVLDLILAIGQMCRQAAERITGPMAPPPESAPPPLAEPDPPELDPAPAEIHTAAEPPLDGTGSSLRAAPDDPVPPAAVELESPIDSLWETSAPAFTQLKKASSLWRIPVVSSFLLTTGGLLLLHYL